MDTPPLQDSSSSGSSRSTTPSDIIVEEQLTFINFLGLLVVRCNAYITTVSSNKIR